MANKVEIDFHANTADAAANIRKLDGTLADFGVTGKLSAMSLTDLKSGIDLTVGALKTMAQVGQQAFAFGKEGAAVTQTTESFAGLMTNVGASSDLLAQLRTASAGTISDMKLMSATTTLLAGAQGDLATSLAAATPQLLEIAKAANKLNPSLGDTTFLYESLATGVKRASPMILDNLGLTIKIGQANETYAKLLGKTVEQLTAEEQKQALLNETLRAGAVLIEQAGGAAGSATDDYARFEASAENLNNQLKQLSATMLGSLVAAEADQFTALNEVNAAYKAGTINTAQYTANMIMLLTPLGIFTDELTALRAEVAKNTHNQASLNRETEIAAAATRDYGSSTGEAKTKVRELTGTNSSTAAYYRTVVEGATAAGEAQDDLNAKLDAMRGAALSAGLSGTLTAAQETYRDVIAETSPEIEKLTAEIVRMNAAQGTTWTVTTEAKHSVAEYELAQIKAATAAKKLAEFTGDNREEYLELVIAADSAAERVAKMGTEMGMTEQFTADYTKKLMEANGELSELEAQQLAAEEAMKRATAQFLYQQIAADLDREAALSLARELGLLSEADYIAATAAQTLGQAFKDGKLDADEMTTATGLLRDVINALQSKEISITVSTFYKEYYEQVGMRPEHEGDTGAGGEGGYGGGGPIDPGGGDSRDNRASGGAFMAGQRLMVGEHGPEEVRFGAPGYVVPTDQLAPTVTIENFYGAPNMDVKALAAQFGAALAGQLRAALASGTYRAGRTV